MGIVNLTDDSFFASGRVRRDQIEEVVCKMISQGADVLDFGACASSPSVKEFISLEEEWKRLKPALELVRDKDIEISIDTFRSEIVLRALDVLGKRFIVNDISAGGMDAAMLETVGESGLKYIAVHGGGLSRECPAYENGIEEAVMAFFDDFAVKAESTGIKDWMPDPGFGFSKSLEDNWTLFRGLRKFRKYGRKVVVGVSRKRMICNPLGLSPEDALSATQAVHMAALMAGADILRVHDVKETKNTIELYRRCL